MYLLFRTLAIVCMIFADLSAHLGWLVGPDNAARGHSRHTYTRYNYFNSHLQIPIKFLNFFTCITCKISLTAVHIVKHFYAKLGIGPCQV